MQRILFKVFLLILFLNLQFAFSQDGELDLSFNSPVHLDYPPYNGSYNGRIYCTKILDDGKILIYGDIDDYFGQEVNKLFRIFPDGRLDNSFDVGTGPNIQDIFINQNSNAIFIQEDGKILVGGNFTSFNNVPRKKIVRLNTDGSVDLSFNAGNGNFDGMILAIKGQSDGKIICGGIFNLFNGFVKNNLVRLNANGTLDYSFNIGAGFNYSTSSGTIQSSYVNTIDVTTDNKIIVGGYFNRYKNLVQKGIVRLNENGTKDNTFLVGSGTNEIDVIRKIYINPVDSKIYIAGSISEFNGLESSNVIKLNADGSTDTTFTVTENVVSNNFNTGISDFGILSNGNIIVSGDFTLNQLQDLAMYNSSGNLIENFKFKNEQSSNNPEIYCLSVTDNDAIYVGGYFKNINQIYNSKGSIVKIQPDGETDLSFNPNYGAIGLYGISKCYKLDDGTILLSSAQQYNERKIKNLIRINENGSIVDSVYINFRNLNISGISISSDANNKVILSNGSGVHKIFKNGLIDTSFTNTEGLLSNINNFIRTISVQNDNKILVAGNFKLLSNNLYRQRIYRTNEDGSIDLTFNVNKGFNGTAITTNSFYINNLKVQPDNKIIAGGKFTNFNDISCNNLTRINTDGSIDVQFNTNIGSGLNKETKDIILQPNGKIVIVGSFTLFNGLPTNYIIRLNENGTVDNTFVSPFNNSDEFNRITKIKILNNGKFIIVGVIDGIQKLLRLNENGTIDTTFFSENDFLRISQADNNINNVDLIKDLAILDNSKILVVGDFYKVNNITRHGFALFNNDDELSVNPIKDDKKENISLVPNPVDDFVTIESSKRYSKVDIYDISGRFISSEFLHENSCNLNYLKSGIYILKINTIKQGIKLIKK